MARNLLFSLSLGVVLLLPFYSFSQSAPGGVEDVPSFQIKDTLWVDDLIGTAIELRRSDPIRSITLLEDAYEIADSLKDIHRMERSLSILGTRYLDQGSHGQALEAYFEALSLQETQGDVRRISNTHHNLSNAYRKAGDFEKALEQEKIALEMKLEAQETRELHIIYSTIGSIYAKLEQYEKALSSHQKGLGLAIEFGLVDAQGEILGNIANVFNLQGDYNAARSYHFKALDIHEETGSITSLVIEMNNLANNYQQIGMLDSARFFYEKSYLQAESLNSPPISLFPAKGLWEVFTELGKYESANHWAEIVLALQDSVSVKTIASQMKTAEVRYDLKLKEKELEYKKEAEQLKREVALQRQRAISLGAAIGGFLLAVIALVFYFRFQNRKRTAEILEKTVEDRTADLSYANGRLREEALEKEKAKKILSNFLYRSSHDLRGPVTSIKGLLGIEALLPKKSPYHDMICLKVEQLDGVLRSLVEKLELDQHQIVAEEISWEKCWQTTLQTLEPRSGFQACCLKFENQTTAPICEDPFLIQVLMNQLVRNSIDFRDTDKKEQFCYVTIEGEDGNWCLEVRDNGIGILPLHKEQIYEMFFRGDKRSRGAGIGLHLVQEICTLLGQKTHLESEVGRGTNFKIQAVSKGNPPEKTMSLRLEGVEV